MLPRNLSSIVIPFYYGSGSAKTKSTVPTVLVLQHCPDEKSRVADLDPLYFWKLDPNPDLLQSEKAESGSTLQ